MTVGDLIIELMKFDTNKIVKLGSTEFTENGPEEFDIIQIDKNREDGGPLII